MVKIKAVYCLASKVPSATLLALLSLNATAENILLTNDDGLTSNVLALYSALKRSGHDVIVSVPCQGQSGMGAAILFLKPLSPLMESCLNDAGLPGDPAAGPVTRKDEGFSYSDVHYVNGTPVMATAYGLDVLAERRWGGPPDLVLSGPNEGRNAGPMINSSGTVSNAQYAAAHGIPAIALSAGINTSGTKMNGRNIADNPLSFAIAKLTTTLVNVLLNNADGNPLLPEYRALNVNFPDDVGPNTPWKLTRIGTYSEFILKFSEDFSPGPFAPAEGVSKQSYPGLNVMRNTAPPTEKQMDDEAHVSQTAISVSVMQVSFDTEPLEPDWLRSWLRELLK